MKEIDVDRATLLCTYLRSYTELAENLIFDNETELLSLAVCNHLYALFDAARIFNGALLDLLLGGSGAVPILNL